MAYKKNCNFREKINACTFKAEDCNKKNCDFHSLKWNWMHLLRKLKIEQNRLNKLKKQNADKKLIKDIEYGIVFISQAICEITGFNPSVEQVEELRKSIKKQ